MDNEGATLIVRAINRLSVTIAAAALAIALELLVIAWR